MGIVRSLFFLLSTATWVFATSPIVERGYSRGLEAYEQQQYSLAIQEFEDILAGGYEAQVLYYNLGNAYYRNGHVSGAVWAYEKALALSPNDKDAKYNLVLANLRVEDRIATPEIPFIIRLYRAARGYFTPGDWVWWLTIIFLLNAIVFAGSKFTGFFRYQALSVPIGILMIGLSALTVDSILTERSRQEGIIFSELATVYSAPTERATPLFEVHEGLKVGISQEQNEWIEIDLIDGKSGWMPTTMIRAL